jgi:hypothetical protein
MGAERAEADGGAEKTVERALAAYFAVQRLEAESRRSLHRTVMPSLLLWVHAWRPLPDLLVWSALMIWATFAALAVVLAACAIPRRARLQAALPEAQQVVRLHFAPARTGRVASALFFYLAIAVSVLLWLHAAVPHLVGRDVASMAARSWVLLLAAAAANRYLERP